MADVKLKLGDKVRMVNCREADKYGDKTWTTRSEPWVIGGGHGEHSGGIELIMLEGFSGGFDTRRLELVRE